LEAGLLTPYRGGEIARLEPQAQQAALTIWTTRARQKQQSGTIAAAALRHYLASSAQADLSEACSIIRAAVEKELACITPPEAVEAFAEISPLYDAKT
jgi:hypothetical protein